MMIEERQQEQQQQEQKTRRKRYRHKTNKRNKKIYGRDKGVLILYEQQQQQQQNPQRLTITKTTTRQRHECFFSSYFWIINVVVFIIIFISELSSMLMMVTRVTVDDNDDNNNFNRPIIITSSSSSSIDNNNNKIIKEHQNSLLELGNPNIQTSWTIDTLCLLQQQQQQQQQQHDMISKNHPILSIYSVGVGDDISWELEMIQKFGSSSSSSSSTNIQIHLFDPTPKSIAYVKPIIESSKKYNNQLFFTPEGLSDVQGNITFIKPINPNHVSLRMVEFADHEQLANNNNSKRVTLPVNTLQNWMKHRNHNHIDILKMDIEGSEYDVLESFIEHDYLPFTQLLVKYHIKFLPVDTRHSRHNKIIQNLQLKGYVELWSKRNGQEIGYIKQSDIPIYCNNNHHQNQNQTTTSNQ